MKIPLRQTIKEIESLKNKKVKSVIYAGTDLGNDASNLVDLGVSKVLWLESSKNKMSELYNRTKLLPLNQQYVCEMFADVDKSGEMIRFDSFYRKNLNRVELQSTDLIINMNDFGNEDKFLIGFGKYLDDSLHSGILGIYTKLRGINEMDNFLGQRGFKRILTNVNEIGWGEALYVKEGFVC